MNTATTHTVDVAAAPSHKAIAALALVAGLALVFVTGFANSTTLHNAAHDSRHTMAFPCH